MSHVVKVELQIKDLAALEAACKARGLELVRGQSSYRWFGDMDAQSDAYYRQSDQDGKCDHAIRIAGSKPGTQHEIGVRKATDGSYTLAWDPMGQIVSLAGGHDARGLRQEYSAEVASKYYRTRGYRVSRSVKDDGKIVLKAVR